MTPETGFSKKSDLSLPKFTAPLAKVAKATAQLTPVARVIARARAEIGYLEKASNKDLDDKLANAGKNNWTKYARDLDGLGNIYNGKKNGYDWCDVFVDWVFITEFGETVGMELLCQVYQGLGAGVRYSANYYRVQNQFYESDPQPGDQIFFGDATSYWHTGIVTEVRNGRVYTIEGNTTGASGVVSNGGGVAEKSYALNYKYIIGYGRPDWSLVVPEFIVPTEPEKEDDDVDLPQFKELWHAMRAELQDNDSSAYSEAAREWAVSKGLTNGAGGGNYMWEDILTREQFFTALYRFAQMIGAA